MTSPFSPGPTLIGGLACGGGLLTLLSALCLVGAPGVVGAQWLSLALCMVFLVALAIHLLRLHDYPTPTLLMALAPIGLAFFLRGLCLDYQSHDYLTFLADWAAFFRDYGGFPAIALPKGDYNVPYLYFMAAISYLDLPDLYLIKLFSILFDVLLAWGGLRLVAHFAPKGSKKPLATFCLLLLLPTVILNGSYWGQCDSIYAALCLHATASAFEKRPYDSVILLALAFSFKLQTVFLMPLWALFWMSGRVKFRHLLAFPATYLASILPALAMGKPLEDILGVYFHQAVEYQNLLTLNAPSVYAIIPYGMEVDEPALARLGILAAFGLLLLLYLVFFLRRHHISDQSLLTAGILMAVGIPLLLPHMHDRYFFLADVLTLCWAVLSPRRIPQLVGVHIASLGAYHAYLILQYAFPMAWGAYLLIATLLLSLGTLYFQLFPPKQPS